MTTGKRPDFMEWVIVDQDGWRLKKDAPEEVKKKFEKYMEETKAVEFNIK